MAFQLDPSVFGGRRSIMDYLQVEQAKQAEAEDRALKRQMMQQEGDYRNATLDIARQKSLYDMLQAQQPEYKVVGNQMLKMDKAAGTVEPIYSAPNQPTEYQQMRVDMQREQNQRMADDRARIQKESQDKALQAQTEKYSKTLESTGLSDLLSAAERAKNAVSGEGDIPGYGEIVGALPDWMSSQAGKDTRQSIAELQNALLKARSGGAVTPGEYDRLKSELGAGFGRGDANLRKGIANVTATLQNKMRNAQAGYSPEAVGLYEERGGLTGRNLNSTIKPPVSTETQPIIGGKINYADPRVQKAFDVGYNEQQILQYLGGQ